MVCEPEHPIAKGRRGIHDSRTKRYGEPFNGSRIEQVSVVLTESRPSVLRRIDGPRPWCSSCLAARSPATWCANVWSNGYDGEVRNRICHSSFDYHGHACVRPET